MRNRCIKKTLVALLAFMLMFGSSVITSNAHVEINFLRANGHDPSNIRFYIFANTYDNPLFTLSNFRQAATSTYGWNAISINIGITEITNFSDGGDSKGAVAVFAENLGSEQGGIVKLRQPNGELVDIDMMNCRDNWHKPEIYINYNDAFWGKNNALSSMKADRMVSVFRHEVGHVLKLQHPTGGLTPNTFSGHIVGFASPSYPFAYYPRSIMNIGSFPDENIHVTREVTAHDRQNLKSRWGNCTCSKGRRCTCNYRLGDVDGDGNITLADANQILMYSSNMPSSVIHNSQKSLQASCIVVDSKVTGIPTVSDALDIQMYISGMTASVLTNLYR